MPTSGELLSGVRHGMVLLQQPGAYAQYQDAHGQLVAGLVHALHGVPPGDAQLRAQAEAVVQQHIFQPLTAALGEVRGLMGGGPAGQQPAAAVRAAVWRLHAALRQFQALLNQLESYSPYESDSSSSVGGSSSSLAAAAMATAATQEAMARGMAADAVASFLSCWPQLAEVCVWAGQLPATPSGSSGLAAVRREAYAELAQCLSSCIALEQEAAQAALPSLAAAAAAHFFLPGEGAAGAAGGWRMPWGRPCAS